jgi:hypothetical protein
MRRYSEPSVSGEDSMNAIDTEVTTDDIATSAEPTLVAAWEFAADAALAVDEARRRIFQGPGGDDGGSSPLDFVRNRNTNPTIEWRF